MATATNHEISEATISGHKKVESSLEAAAPKTRKSAVGGPDRVARLKTLLAEDPVDLAHVSDEIRSQPELADAVKRVAASLQLLPAGLVTSVEEAAIVLGTERLRVLLHAWPACEKAEQRSAGDGTEAAAPGAAEPSLPANGARVAESLAASAAPTAELLYLAGLVRLLGTGKAEASSSDGGALGDGSGAAIAELTEMLVRDFLALIPGIDRLLVNTVRRGDGLDNTR